MINLQMNARDWALLVALSVIWGGSFFFNEVLLETLQPLTVVLGRVGIAAVALWAIVGVRGLAVPRARSTWRDFVVMGLLNNVVPFALIVWGQSQITGGLASILNATTPLFTVLLANVLTQDERLSSNKLVGVLLGLAGVALLIGVDALRGIGVALDEVVGETVQSSVWGQVAVLGAALSYAFAVIYGRRFRGIPPVITATGTLSAATLLLLPVALVIEQPWTLSPTGATWAALLGIALLSTVVAYLIYYYLIAHAGATNASLVTLLIPLSAILLGAVFLGERLAWSDFAGMGLILAGLIFVDGRVVRRRVAVQELSTDF